MSIQCQHAHATLVQTWAEGQVIAVGQCDNCGALLNPGCVEVDALALPLVDVRLALAHVKAIDEEVRRLERLLSPSNPTIRNTASNFA